MADYKNQGFSTGEGGVLLMAGVIVDKTDGTITLPDDGAYELQPTDDVFSLYDATGAIKKDLNLELAVFTSERDEVGIVTATFNPDGTPKTFTATIDRDDEWTEIFMNRYAVSLRHGLETPSSIASQTEKTYSDGGSVRGEAEVETVNYYDTLFMVHIGPRTTNRDGNKVTRRVTYGFVGLANSTPNASYTFQTDNQFTFTLNGAPQEYSAKIDLSTFIFNSAAGIPFGSVGGKDGLDRYGTTVLGDLGKVFGGYEFVIPAKTSFIQTNLVLDAA